MLPDPVVHARLGCLVRRDGHPAGHVDPIGEPARVRGRAHSIAMSPAGASDITQRTLATAAATACSLRLGKLAWRKPVISIVAMISTATPTGAHRMIQRSGAQPIE